MEQHNHHFSELFKQLGLPESPTEIERFITTHSPMNDDVKLLDAPFWNDSQRAFLKESYADDADWVPMIDQLNEALHPRRR
ncbi:DUF2789 domain-containing protein [Streptomyces sp. MBT67]|uniref:DUF2789 domain-containing protein n=1 Tax=unclassified Streptomyces TaxID=2593676 RepID=UPI00190D480A|nr:MULTISPECIES: DUF2789 domain-containing protein [unclassified Streptomyces]MBK3529850.1 DUF2789 domain-containing protein [Streptomyces sp. MBT72]MBK3535684.1 DUF2789 domain-containing protein [Streptomyces sp. MBT67]MBK3550997.1 DUF2789 domain-containing protein [Streptomyces sp. MBT61]MBK6027724.1 DUF2789 domain-containing protein [Streptomyces sp. MBT59]